MNINNVRPTSVPITGAANVAASSPSSQYSRNTDQTEDSAVGDFGSNTHLRNAVEYGRWACSLSFAMGLMYFVHYPALRRAFTRLQNEHAKPLAERSRVQIVSDSIAVTTASSSMLSLTLGQLGENFLASEYIPVLNAVSSWTNCCQIPFMARNMIIDARILSRQVTSIRADDSDFVANMELANPAQWYLLNVLNQMNSRRQINTSLEVNCSRIAMIAGALLSGGWLPFVFNQFALPYFFQAMQHTTNEPTEFDEAIVILIAKLAIPLTAEDMRSALLQFSTGSYLSVQMNGAKYSDEDEKAFLQRIIESVADKPDSIVQGLDRLRALETLDNIFGDVNAMEGNAGFILNTDLRSLMILIRNVRKMDLSFSSNNRRRGGPFSTEPNHIYKTVILPIIQCNAIRVNSYLNTTEN